MKMILPLFIALLLAGCSKSPLNGNTQGLGYWESPSVVKDAIMNQSSHQDLSTYLSTYLLIHPETNWDDYDFVMKQGMGNPELMAQRAMKKFKSIIRKEDFKNISWVDIDPFHAEGEIEFDAFYGYGMIKFKAVKIDNKWVVNQMVIPSKEKNPLVVFDYSEEEAKKLIQ